jgi:arginine exporter protein ArgO
LNPQKATLLGVGITGAFGALLLLARVREKFNLQTAAALAAVMAMTLFYHRPYDNLLLIFLLLPLVAAAFREQSRLLFAASAALAVILYFPAGVVLRRLAEIAPVTDWVMAIIPVAACAILLLTTQPRSGSTSP